MKSLRLVTLLLVMSACVPQKGGSLGGNGKDSAADSNSLALTTVRVGPGSAYNAEKYNGDYYSKYNPVVFNGSCSGSVQQVLVEDTPDGGSTTSQTLSCSGGTFSWTKSLGVEKKYALVFTPKDSGGTTISDVAVISKNYTYDVTNPTAPSFVSPSVTNNYTITNGSTSVTIAGQVLNEVVKLIGPYSINLPLVADPDGIHKNFAFNATVAVGTSANFTFTASDAAGNSSASTMAIDSVLNLSIPVAAQEIGGSHQTSGGLKIESTVGIMSEVIINNNVKHVTGSAGIMGNL